MRLIAVSVYENRWGKSLCVEYPKVGGYRVAGMEMDGTNKQIATFTVDADELVSAIERESFER